MFKINVVDKQKEAHSLEIDEGQTVMEVVRELDHGVDAFCGGALACATCHVHVGSEWIGKLEERSQYENLMLEALDTFSTENSRLSCQIKMTEELDGLELAVVSGE